MLASAEFMHFQGIILIFFASLLTILCYKEILSVLRGSPVAAVDNGIECHCYVPETVGTLTFVSSGFFLFLFSPSYGDVGEQVLCNGCSVFQV